MTLLTETEPKTTFRQWLGGIFSIDPRSLAAMRIGMGLCLIWEALRDATVFRQYFLEDGLTPSFLFNGGMQRWQSVFFICGHPAWTYSMFALQIVLALMLVIGWRTRFATIGCFVMAWSLVNRNNLLATGGHNLLCWMLIWSCFLPLGAAASVDAKTAQTPRRNILSAATVGILLQMVFLYAVAVGVKMNPHWYSELDAVHGFLRSHIGNPLGRAMSVVPEITAFLCIATLLLESTGPTLALISGNSWLRSFIVLIFISFHIGLSATLYIGAFGWICVAAWMIYFPGSFWDFLAHLGLWRRLTSAWDGTITRISDAVDNSWLAVRSMKLRLGIVPSVFVCVLICMMCIWNLTTIAPRLGPLFPGSNRKLKQVWTVMDVPWNTRMRLLVEADCVDESKVTLVAPSPYALSPRWFDYLWAPERGPETETQVRMIRLALRPELDDKTLPTYLERLRTQWNTSHDHAQRIVRIRAIMLVSSLPPPASRTLEDRSTVRHLLYEWVDTPQGGKLTYYKPG